VALATVRRVAAKGNAVPHKPASSALARFTVLDLTRVRSGPTAVRQLADWGAKVIKIEMPEGLEPGDAPGGPRHSSDFQNLQRNKRSLTLNLKSPEGVAIFKRMVETADVVVENYRPDVKHRLGIDYEALSAINPRLVYASISGFGQAGPYRDRPGFDQIAQGMGGLMSITGLPGQGPVRVGIPIADLCAGLSCAQGILVALLEREVSGRGQWLHTSLLQAQIFMLDFQAARWLVEHEVPKQAGNNHPTSIPTGVFPTRDGYLNIAVTGQKIWERFCNAIDAPELIKRPEYAGSKDRSKNRDALNREIAERTKLKDSKAWVEAFNAAGVPSGPIYSIDQVFADPQVQQLPMTGRVQSPKLGELTLVAQPVTLTRTPSSIQMPPPECGEHTDEILAEYGYSKAEIDKLREGRIV
jgi:crotonobetainyl-CoA:carnitine CoA-transferase CaiB-like acyl-CoA transferase